VRAIAVALVLLATPLVHAAPVVADRAVARFSDPEASDQSASLRFVMMRELVIEGWLAAYERAPIGTTPTMDDKTLRIALERHVIETVLGTRALAPAVEAKVAKSLEDVKLALTVSVGGDARLKDALARATGSDSAAAPELATILKRRARAELYLEVATGQLIEPNESELRAAHAKLPMFAKVPYDEVAKALRAYLRTQRLRDGAQAYHQAVRSKLRLEIIPPL
jgi:hypothetical protein